MAGGWDRAKINLTTALTTRPANVAANTASVIGLLLALIGLFKLNLTVIPLVYLCGLSLFLLYRYMAQERWGRYAEGCLVMERAERIAKEATDRLLFDEGAGGEAA